jgi:Fur family ferric uptake transcriptional regulator
MNHVVSSKASAPVGPIATDDKVSTLTDSMAERGYRLTNARQAIVAALVACEGHISADDLVESVRRDAPGVGRMTVYRTLELLTGLGLIRPVYLGTGAAHYILLVHGHHHHLVCSSCHRVFEFGACALSELEDSIGREYGFEVHGHLLELFGRCRDCASGRPPEHPVEDARAAQTGGSAEN